MSEQQSSAGEAHAHQESTEEQDHPHACNDGWVSMEVEAEDGTTEEVLYLCRRCPEAAEAS